MSLHLKFSYRPGAGVHPVMFSLVFWGHSEYRDHMFFSPHHDIWSWKTKRCVYLFHCSANKNRRYTQACFVLPLCGTYREQVFCRACQWLAEAATDCALPVLPAEIAANILESILEFGMILAARSQSMPELQCEALFSMYDKTSCNVWRRHRRVMTSPEHDATVAT